jgi:hypothetical protein
MPDSEGNELKALINGRGTTRTSTQLCKEFISKIFTITYIIGSKLRIIFVQFHDNFVYAILHVHENNVIHQIDHITKDD